MTTIVVKDGTIYADSLAVTGDWKHRQPIEKVLKTKKGHIACAGDLADLYMLRKIVEEMEEQDVEIDKYITDSCFNEEDRSALLYVVGKNVYLYNSCMFIPLGTEHAIGSGSVFAIAALELGHTAREAVEVAIKLDPYSGGDIYEYK